MCCCACFCLWRFIVCIDDWLVKYVKPFHGWFFECVVRLVLPGFPAPRPFCEFFTYCCLICPVECYRCCTYRQPSAVYRLLGDMVAFFFRQFDLFDVEEITDALGNMPDWKRYMLTGKWPWDQEEEEEEEGDDEENEGEES
ncbi:unnamed protein product [Trichobilharzia regenti]|nr:unnamed protein product [Trichobilharzia regenti]